MEIGGIKEYLAEWLGRVQDCVNTSLKSDIALLNATNRSLQEHSGKMLRPMLALLCGGACGKLNEDTVRFAASAELMHNATLLHDDVVDHSGERRGHPTVFSMLGGSPAVLIGDYWLVRCMQTILSAAHDSERVLRVFSGTLSDLAEGELLQMEKASSCDTTREDYLRIIYNKTGSLFETAAVSAAISVHASDQARTAVGSYARNLGIAFQIKDDILDYEADEATVGKPVGIDLMEQKITQPLLCALENVPVARAEEIRRKVALISDSPSQAEEVRSFVLEQGGIDLAKKVLEEFVNKAIACLEPLPDTLEKGFLADLARYVGLRSN
ncbi:MAG: polyprenyl synthetase family protein [Bacteroidales bacterium]|nr:polyprenyl synthetase family protein [Bacteroidales bacterium]